MFKIGKKSFVGSVVATAVLACVASTASQATIYNVNDAVGSGSDHAFWLPTVNSWLGLGTHDFSVVNATLDWDSSGGVGSVAKLRGTIASQNDAGKKFDLFSISRTAVQAPREQTGLNANLAADAVA